MELSDRDIRLARLMESEHGRTILEVVDYWIEGILSNLEMATVDEISKVVGAYLNMKQFRNHLDKTPEVVGTIGALNRLESEQGEEF